jgi:hypothetical protein
LKSSFLIAACMIALACCSARVTAGEVAEDLPKPPPKTPAPGHNPAPANNSTPTGPKDPTQLSPRMREMLAPKAIQAQEVAKAPPPKAPDIYLRGLVVGKDSQGSAALEVKGGDTVLVRPGSTFHANSGTGSLQVVVRTITAEAITLEFPELQQTLTIR